MKFLRFWWLLGGLVGGAAADPGPSEVHGRIEAVSADGHLSSVETRWNPRPGWSGRWWWDETGGSAWVGIGGFQAGPLKPSGGSEGERSWTCGTDLSPGHWGLAADLGPAGLWAVQNPGSFEAGLQGLISPGIWTLAAGGDRTWWLSLPVTDLGPVSDRGRVGVRADGGFWSAGAEGGMVRDGRGTGWWTRGRGRGELGPWAVGLRGGAATGPGDGLVRWDASVKGGLGPVRVLWSRTPREPSGRAEAGWESEPASLGLAWGPDRGFRAEAEARGALGGLELAATVVAVRNVYWTESARVSASGREGSYRWKACWGIGPGPEGPRQAWEVEGRTGGFSAAVEWKTEGFRLGWLGPQTGLKLTVAWEF